MRHQSLAALVMATAVTAVPKASLFKRDPSDQSGSVQIALTCESTLVPQPGGAGGEGEGGTNLELASLAILKDGKTIGGTNCNQDDGLCTSCDLTAPGMDTIRAQGCNFTPGGAGACNVRFSYNGYDYDTSAGQPYCGHIKGGFEAFSSTNTALCFFDP